MAMIRLIALAVLALCIAPSVGSAQSRSTLPGAKTAVEYNAYVKTLTGYEFAVPGQLFDHGRRIKCGDGKLVPVLSEEQLALQASVCNWYVPQNVVVRFHMSTGMSDELALTRAIEYTLRSSLARGGGLELANRRMERVGLADGVSAEVIRLGARTGDARNKWTPYVATVLPQKGKYSLLLFSFSTADDCSPENGDQKCLSAVRSLLANMKATGDKLAGR